VKVIDWGALAQQAAEAHLVACEDAMDGEQDSPDPADWPESPACGPYDGCHTCMVREVLFASWPVLACSVLTDVAETNRTLAVELAEQYEVEHCITCGAFGGQHDDAKHGLPVR
jgi:hypothetical protein